MSTEKELRSQVLSVIQASPNPVSSSEISMTLGKSIEAVSLSLFKLFRAKEVKRKQDNSGRNKYQYVSRNMNLEGFYLRPGCLPISKAQRKRQALALQNANAVVEQNPTATVDRITICLEDRDITLSIQEAKSVARVLERVLRNVAP